MEPSPLTIIWSMLAATSFILGLMHTVLWLRLRRPPFLAAAIMAVASGFSTLNELHLMFTLDVPHYAAGLRLHNLLIAIVLIAMIVYVNLRLETGRRWLMATIAGLWSVGIVANFLSPHSLVYAPIEELRRLPTFWGETFIMAAGPTNPWKYAADAASLLILVYVVDAAVQAWRRGRRHGALVIGGSIGFFIAAAGFYTPLVDAAVVHTPSIISATFLAILVALSWEIVREAARAREMDRELEHTRSEMDRLLRANLLGEFASAIAHELNQPLTAVLANAQVARRYLNSDPPRLDEAREMLELVIRDDKRAAGVIQHMHGLVATGATAREPLDLNAVVRETVALCDREARNRSIDMALDLAPHLPQVDASRVELQQVVLNLLYNALQSLATTDEVDRRVGLSTRPTTNGVQLTIVDSGVGVPAAEQEGLFEPFQTNRENGIGMGLAICRRIIEAHGGAIRSTESTDGGACFLVDLPAQVNQAAADG